MMRSQRQCPTKCSVSASLDAIDAVPHFSCYQLLCYQSPFLQNDDGRVSEIPYGLLRRCIKPYPPWGWWLFDITAITSKMFPICSATEDSASSCDMRVSRTNFKIYMKYIFAVTYETASAEDGASCHDASRKANPYSSHILYVIQRKYLSL